MVKKIENGWSKLINFRRVIVDDYENKLTCGPKKSVIRKLFLIIRKGKWQGRENYTVLIITGQSIVQRRSVNKINSGHFKNNHGLGKFHFHLGKTRVMVCTSGFIWGKQGVSAYKWRAMGGGYTFRYRNKTRLSCKECGMTMVELLLWNHTERVHGVFMPQTCGVDIVRVVTEIYVVSFQQVLKSVSCTLDRCPESSKNLGRLRENFM